MQSREMLVVFSSVMIVTGCNKDPEAPHPNLAVIVSAADSFHSDNPALESLFRSALRSTFESAYAMPDGTVYIKTGDISAEWLRDSSAQARPYLYFAGDAEVAAFLRGVIERQALSIARNPYANAFTYDYGIWEE